MEEEARVNVRLERIGELRRGEAPTHELLAELRGLLEDGAAWLGATTGETRARSAVHAPSQERGGSAKEVTPEGWTGTLI